MKAHLTRRYMFSASHRLHSDEMSEEENRATYGKCSNPYGHGHNYMLEVTVSGQLMTRPAWSATWSIWMASCTIISSSATTIRTLNLLSEFAKQVPTTENLCIAIYEIVKRGFHNAHLDKVRIEETMMNSFEYSGEAGR